MPALLAGVDVGTTAVKALAINEEGRVLARAEVGYPLSTPRPGWAEQAPEDWWRATQSVLAELKTMVGSLTAIGLSGQMHGLVAMDARDRVLRPAILWNDQRTAAESRQIEETIGLERLIALTGNRALPGFTAPKLLWLRTHERDIFDRIARIALPKDYVRLRLCGEHVTDVADASGTLLLDVAARKWSAVVVDALELDSAWLPTVLEGPALSGRTPDGVPVAAGGGDVSLTAASSSESNVHAKPKHASGGSGPTQLTLLLDWFPHPDHASLYVAQAKGYFKHAGLDMTLQAPSNASDPAKLVSTGNVPLGISYEDWVKSPAYDPAESKREFRAQWLGTLLSDKLLRRE